MLNNFSGSFAFGRRIPDTVVPATPTAILNNAIWFNADLSNNTNFQNPPTSGSKVNQWLDRSGQAHNINSAGGARPTWVSPVQNNYGVIRLDGTAAVMTLNPIVFMQSLPAYTLFIVAKASSLTGTQYLSSTDTNGFSFYHNGSVWLVSTSGGIGTSSVAGDTTNFRIFCIVYDGTQADNASRLKFRYAGSDQTLNFGATTVGSTTNAAAKYWYLGANSTGAANYFNGDIAEVIMYTRALPQSEIRGVETYLKSHWAI